MDKVYSVTFKNPYRIRHNWFTYVYKVVHQQRNSWASKLFQYPFKLCFDELAFFLLKCGFEFNTIGFLGDNRFTLRGINSQFHSIYFDEHKDCYEPPVFAAIETFLPKGGTFVDVGSNWGHHSFCAVSEKKCNVLAVEPNPRVFSDMSAIVAELSLSDVVQVKNVAIGQTVGNLYLTQDSFESGSASVDEEFLSFRNQQRSWLHRLFKRIIPLNALKHSVPVVTLDSICGSLDSFEVLKLDCEGVELDVLRSGLASIERFNPTILFEYHSANEEVLSRFLKFFSEICYDVKILEANTESGELILTSFSSLEVNKRYDLIATRREIIS